jgi:hypothetical protein
LSVGDDHQGVWWHLVLSLLGGGGVLVEALLEGGGTPLEASLIRLASYWGPSSSEGPQKQD